MAIFAIMELLYQYLWKYGLFGRRLPLIEGGEVEVVNTGLLNLDSGPDFFNARLDFGEGVWAGNVEIHVKASDWYRHGHDSDPAYDTVLLHVVGIHDRKVTDRQGKTIPATQVTIPQSTCLTYAELLADRKGVRCQTRLREIPQLELTSWIETLAIERLQMKASRVVAILEQTGGDWERALFITLARGLGFSLNSEPMEQLARSVESNHLGRHSDNLMQLEAILFGQAGLLDPTCYQDDEYYQLLCREYSFLSRKYGMRGMGREAWKYTQGRPLNFPPRRIALLARILYGGKKLLSRILDTDGRMDRLEELFGWEIEGHWRRHRDFGTPEEDNLPQRLGKANRRLLIINVAVPVLYAYGSLHGDIEMTEKAISLLEELPAEKNSKITQWEAAGLKAEDAMRSQALLQLRNEYCDRGRCRECRYGYSLLKMSLRQET